MKKNSLTQIPLTEDIRVEYIPLDEIVGREENVKDHDSGALHHSINRFGFSAPLVLDERTGVLVAGHGRLAALSQMREAGEQAPRRIRVEADGRWSVPVVRGISFNSDSEAAAYAVADNRLVELGGWQRDRLADLLKGFAEEDDTLLSATGFDGDDLDDLLKDLTTEPIKQGDVADVEPELDRAGELQERWATKRGQLWIIESKKAFGGAHRLYCGDSTDIADIAALFDGKRASLVVTSPPYGVGKDYEEGGLLPWSKLMASVTHLWRNHVDTWAVNLGDIKVGPDHRELHTYGAMVSLFESVGIPLIGTRLWAKPPCWATGPYWLSSYRSVDEFEYIGLFGKQDYKDRVRDDWRYRGIWEFPSVHRNDKHPAMFPVELPRRLILLLSDAGGVVADPFMGSGTTLVACEGLGRLAFGCERDPKYLAVSLQRAADIGLSPKLVE